MEYGGQKILQRFGGVPGLAMKKKKKNGARVFRRVWGSIATPSFFAV